ncbi:short-chain dehydrogenase [Exiguobacterium profundum]|uniref:short-chain dehydrogenase n=1 Tax=Exiguobacterium TaxID=33986 RepID=UPI001BFBF668|nr:MULTISPECIES: short-chain dehydrogenase [Exiguobacterium]MCT4797289.1 short-chain dehydrogenase [Exiguobacterium profundum]
MSYYHEFGIIDSIHGEELHVQYIPERYGCVVVDGEEVEQWIEQLSDMRTFFHSYHCPGHGLDECGITLIPHASLSFFFEVVLNRMNNQATSELGQLIIKIIKARDEGKDMIHFGL